MPEIEWDAMDERFWQRGVDHGVLYTPTAGVYSSGVAWNGLTGVTQAPSGSESNKQYADNIEYANILTRPMFGATIECVTWPDEFLKHDGVVKTANGMRVSMQKRPIFGFSWRNMVGLAEDTEVGEIINLAWGLQAGPTEKAHTTVNDGVEITTFSWTVTSTPVLVSGMMPTAFVSIDSTDPDVSPEGLEALKDVLYGRLVAPPRLPLPDEVDTLLGS